MNLPISNLIKSCILIRNSHLFHCETSLWTLIFFIDFFGLPSVANIFWNKFYLNLHYFVLLEHLLDYGVKFASLFWFVDQTLMKNRRVFVQLEKDSLNLTCQRVCLFHKGPGCVPFEKVYFWWCSHIILRRGRKKEEKEISHRTLAKMAGNKNKGLTWVKKCLRLKAISMLDCQRENQFTKALPAPS